MADIKEIKNLRDETGASPVDCKKALKEAENDIERAKEILKTWGREVVKKKKERVTEQGIVKSYIHPNSKIGVLLDIRCESDFVAKSEDFKELAHEICLQIASMNPLYVKEEEVPQELLDKEKDICKEQFKDSEKPEEIVEKIIEGKLEKYKEERSLLSQPWVKEQGKTIKDLIAEYISKTGENIEVNKFTRYEI